MRKEEERVVGVSGGSGYVASWLIKVLLQRGYTVKASLRNPNDPRKTEHLLSLDGAKDRLHLFKADLLEEGSFDSLVEGCHGVFHTASPFYYDVNEPQVELIEPAVKGTLNVLKSCSKVPSIKRVVLTSSMSAVLFNGKNLSPEIVVDETWYSDPAVCKQSKLWYSLSKTLAEDAAWKFSKANGINMVSINPGLVIGPLLQPTLNTSVEPILDLIKGSEVFPNVTYRWVDFRDVAEAHVNAFEDSSANGRYCLVGRIIHCSEVVNILQQMYPDLILPKKCADDEPFPPVYQVSKARAGRLGVKFTPVEVSLKDTIESLKQKGPFLA